MGKYKVLQKLGQGSYGTVFLVHDTKDGRLFVMKKITVQGMSANELVDCKREIQILAMLKHPNIIGYQRSFVRRGALCIVMDYADGGDLHRMIHKQRKLCKAGAPGFDENLVLDLLAQVALGLQHIHRHKILHRDLKTQNIFLTKAGGVRLGDFGISRVMSNTMDQAKTLVGTPYYLSPEMVNGLPYDSKTDMWSLGVVLYEMLTLEHPFNADNLQMLALRIIQGNYPPVPACYSAEIQGLLAGLLDQNPATRLSVDQCLAHPLIASRLAKFAGHNASPQSSLGSLPRLQISDDTPQMQSDTSPSIDNTELMDERTGGPEARKKNLVRRAADLKDLNGADAHMMKDVKEPAPALQNHRSASTVMNPTTMDQDPEPEWAGLQRPDNSRSSLYITPQPKPPQPQPRPAISQPKAYQIGVLRGHLLSKLGEKAVQSLMEILTSDMDNVFKDQHVKSLIGPHQELLPIIHTLVYLQYR